MLFDLLVPSITPGLSALLVDLGLRVSALPLVSSTVASMTAVLLKVLVLGSLMPSMSMPVSAMLPSLRIGATTIIPLAVLGRSTGGKVKLDTRAGG